MGLIKAFLGSAGGVLADQWKEAFVANSLEADVLVCKGIRKTSSRSSNTKGTDNVITTGSMIIVADGQCAVITDQGRVTEICAEAGEYTYDASTAPSLFCGQLGKGILDSFKEFGKRFTFGGEAPRDQRVYYFNTKEIPGNKYGTPNPVPFRVVDQNIGLDMDITIRCFGEYSYKITDPILFYKNVCGNVSENYSRSKIDGMLKTELLTALGPAFAKISAMGIRYSALPGHTFEIANALNEVLSPKWKQLRGLEVVSFGVSSVNASEEDEAMIKELQRKATLRSPGMRDAYLAASYGTAMEAAAKNEAGAMTGFMGMGMVGAMGGMMGQPQYQQPAPAPAPAPAVDGWTCACGTVATGKFCPQCGTKKPEPKPADGWTCACGTVATGKFCPECGAKKPASEGWTCSCGTLNKGKFCAECGAKKPAGVPQYKCDKCGWVPADPTKAPRFCPECGDPFDSGDIV